MIGFIALKKVITEFCSIVGIETRYMRNAREQKEDIDYLKAHNEEQDKKIDSIVNGMSKLSMSVDHLSDQLNKIQNKIDENDRSKLGDRLIQSFRYYNEKQQMTSMEKWAFDNLVKSYINAGGDSYIDEKVIPASMNWKVID